MSYDFPSILTPQEVLARYHDGPKSGLFTDGGSRPNPGPGGWAAVLVENDKIIKQIYGHERDTTNNRMELTALIEGLKLLSPGQSADVYSDSELCVNTITKWAAAWERNNWKRKTGPIKNLDLVQEVYRLYKERPELRVSWVKAHNGWRWNEYADSLSAEWTRG
jgi:ribonuclease HI